MRFLTAGESHGPALVGIIEGIPAGLAINEDFINEQLSRRQGGYGRGGRMSIEKDRIKFLSGIRFGLTTGSPLALLIENKDWPNWEKVMSQQPRDRTHERSITTPRPGHADLAGGIKYQHEDLRNVLERASARETAIRVAIGALSSLLLGHFAIYTTSFVIAIGGIKASRKFSKGLSTAEIKKKRGSMLYCLDGKAENLMVEEIDRAKNEGDTLGGVFEIHVEGLPSGLGSHVHWDRRLDNILAGALMSIPAIKGVEVGLGFEAAARRGSKAHDELLLNEKGKICRTSNHAGGLEGGISNGETIVLRATMKPIPTLVKSLSSVDLQTRSLNPAAVERSDTCAVPAASVVGEAVVSWEIAKAFLQKFSGDSLSEVEEAYWNYQNNVREYLGENNVEN
ncbi:MAG TPA: chorismate synthase [Firmicutes bacterium]|nr:chorismate synthase [Bacillota bacterium]